MPALALAHEFDDSPLYRSQLETLREFWLSKCSTESIPQRAEFTARTLKPWIAHVAIVEAIGAPARYRIGQMGMACMRIAGADLTGRWIDECVAHRCRGELMESYGLCLERQEPLLRKVTYVKDRIKRTMVNRLFLPCLGDSAKADTILVAAYAMEELGQFYDLDQIFMQQNKAKVLQQPDTTIFLE